MCYIKIDKKLLEWEWYDDLPTFKLWIHILLNANIEDKTWKGNEVKVGELITSLSHLSKESGLTIKQVRRALANLEKGKELVIDRANQQYTKIIVPNWTFYQSSGCEGQEKGTQSGKQRATTKYINNKENINNINIINKKESYGEYKNVLLTPDERRKLEDKFGHYYSEDLIKYLDEYIEMKGYKAKSHYLAILKWVDDAVSRETKPKVTKEYSNTMPSYEPQNNQYVDTSSLDDWRKGC